jgi:hypothetical protein
MTKLQGTGIHLLGGRNAELRELVPEMPPRVAIRALGYSSQTTEDHAVDAGRTWVTYASYRFPNRQAAGDQTMLE